MLQNAIGGLQGIIDHAMVGHFVGYTANAAIGVSWQIFLVVIVFISSLYAGMGVLVARFAGAGDRDAVDRAVGQAFLVSLVLAGGIMAPVGYVLSPRLLLFVNAAPGGARGGAAVPAADVRRRHRPADVLPARRRVPGRRRPAHAAAPRHPPDRAQRRLQHRADSRRRADPGLRRHRRGDGHRLGVADRGRARADGDAIADGGDPPAQPHRPPSRLDADSAAVQVRPADRLPGRGDERRRRLPAALHRRAAAERPRPGGLRHRATPSCSR